MIVPVLLSGPILGVLYTMPLVVESSENTCKPKHGSYHTGSITAATGVHRVACLLCSF